MRRVSLIAAATIAIAALLSAGCGGLSGGPRKVVLNEGVCGNVKFLKLKLGETNHVILDNSKHSNEQQGITLTMENFPIAIKGEVPPNSKIGDPYSTVRLHAAPGSQATVDIEPTFTGNYIAKCNVARQQGAGQQLIETQLTFQLVEK